MSATITTFPGLHICQHCGMRYDWRRSTSTVLRTAYCSRSCECAAFMDELPPAA